MEEAANFYQSLKNFFISSLVCSLCSILFHLTTSRIVAASHGRFAFCSSVIILSFIFAPCSKASKTILSKYSGFLLSPRSWKMAEAATKEVRIYAALSLNNSLSRYHPLLSIKWEQNITTVLVFPSLNGCTFQRSAMYLLYSLHTSERPFSSHLTEFISSIILAASLSISKQSEYSIERPPKEISAFSMFIILTLPAH